ncbi:two-component system sensor histidine kinase MtrB [Microbacterium terrae]|uniref:Sensor histidine kinase MtrB n=1 Tax=Microbacterium terrae TaxID=69369 RepID=A0A0M2H5Z3_9MICO|nr:MtrAB system histidine kinase MtrB [Microbacterium terrae]KJL41761.1 Sensor histidine kinase MtrB [Microbacterium terrae]MBP1077948.1 two-component system sensor histidine kinase MtrB [Microbacterium terrae]
MTTATARVAASGSAGWRDWRSWPETLSSLWRRSLRFRTLLVTLALTALAVTVACVVMALLIRDDLFDSRLQQALADAQRATTTAQATLDSATVQGDAVQLQNLMTSVQGTLSRQSGADMYAAFRIGPQTPIAPQNFASDTRAEALISAGLRDRVQLEDGADQQWWQSVALPTDDGSDIPGIIVGQQLDVPEVGPYELYFAYDLADASQTLRFVQGTLWFAGIGLVLLISAIAWFVLRSVTGPISEAADTSAKLAAGELGVRLDVRGEDELATLGRSFNAMADSIESQIKELADLSLVQQRFVSDVSHELRTPMTTIRLAADMINDQRDAFDPSTARAAELLNAQVQRFETLLTDLLEISRYDAGSVQLELEPTSLAHLAEDVIGSMHQLAEQHGSDVRLVAPGGYSPVDMDPRRVRRIVRNLIGNAIEHGEARPIVVTVDSDHDAVALGVRDYGLGMRAEDVGRVFDRFWRADPSRKRTIGGTGLGLSIAIGDARLHGGELAVWSELGRGTNFVLTLPRQPGSPVGRSPLAIDPGDEATPGMDDLGLTQPIDVLDVGELDGVEDLRLVDGDRARRGETS